MRISDLIPNREFLVTREYWKQQNAVVLESETTGGHVKGTAETVNSVKRNAPEIDWNYAVVQRMSKEDLSTQLIPFNLGKAILGQDASQQCRHCNRETSSRFSRKLISRCPRDSRPS